MIIRIGTLRAASVSCALILAAALLPQASSQAWAANEIKIVVDGQPITSYDISHRISFLRLQHKKGNLPEMARKQLIDEKVKEIAISRAHASVSTDDVDAAFARFAKSNHMTTARLSAVLDRAGVTAKHFKHFIAVQMSWPRVVQGNAGNGGADPNELVANMLEKGKKKPSTTEYMLQQVIFVVPENRRSAILGRRKHDAEAMRQRFQGCDTTRDFAAKLHDVAVRELGRFLQPQLPAEWKSDIERTPAGKATPVHITKQGAEFIGVCSAKTVSDDAAAASVFSSEQKSDASKDNSAGEKLLAELRKHATITYK